MGVNHILGWYYGKLTWNRMWVHSSTLISRFGMGPRKPALQTTNRIGFRLRTFKNGKEVARQEIRTLSKAIPPVELDKDLSM